MQKMEEDQFCEEDARKLRRRMQKRKREKGKPNKQWLFTQWTWGTTQFWKGLTPIIWVWLLESIFSIQLYSLG